MKMCRNLSLLLAAILMIAGLASAAAAEPNEPDGDGLSAWILGGHQHQELRAGYQVDRIELALGITHHADLDQATSDRLGVRAYALIHAIDANMVGTWFGGDRPLPAGSLYLGAFFGYLGEIESGPVVGAAVEINRRADFITEYQGSWGPVPDRRSSEIILAGLRIKARREPSIYDVAPAP